MTHLAAPEGETEHRVGVLQFEPIHGDVRANFKKARALILADDGPVPAIIVFPEMGLSGYIWSRAEDIMPHAVQCSDPATQAQWVGLAGECQSWLVIGHPAYDATTDRLTNRCTLVSPSGVIGHYDKTCLFVEDFTWATPGTLMPPMWDTPIGTVAPLICADLDYPEPIRSAVSRGAQVIVYPTAWVAEPAPSATWMIRAREHGVPIIAADLLGNDQGRIFSGGSCVMSADGVVIATRDYDEGLVCADLVVAPSRVPSSNLNEPLTVRVHRLSTSPSAATPRFAVISVWSGDPAAVAPAPSGSDGAPHLIVLPTVIDSGDSWLIDSQNYAADHDALVVQGRWSAKGEPVELCIFSPQSGFFSFSSGAADPIVALVEYGGVLVGVMGNTDFNSCEPSRALSVLGASVILGQGPSSISPPPGHAGTLAPFPGGLSDPDPSFGHPVRFRAGDANVWAGFCSETVSVPSGVFSPDHVAWPRNESLGEPGSWVTHHCSLDDLDPWGEAATRKPLVSSRGIELYGDPFLTEITHDQWRKI
ncbi:MAG: putative amidohydrolase [Pontimonas sp.]|jgi:predicted amidohydrolase